MGGIDSAGDRRTDSPPYRCFLLRCWLAEGEEPGDGPAWRFTVHQAGKSGLRRCFARLDDVEAYFGTELALCAEAAGREAD